MFTGIITYLGKVTKNSNETLTIQTDKDFIDELSQGMSISVDGICLTAVDITNTTFSITYMPETSKKTTISSMQKGNLVNLELSATPSTFLAGHIVQGHVDAVSKIVNILPDGNSRIFTFSIPEVLSKYIVEKGSIAVNGISLTVITISNDSFTVGIIPHTWKKTMLHISKVGDFVNIEVDVLAKYIEKLLKK